MCCIFFTSEAPGHHLILASNRDEFLARPTAPAAFHTFPLPESFVPDTRPGVVVPSPERRDAQSSSRDEQHPILSGIDAHPLGGGTWIGISASSGRWAALTNFTEDAPPPIPAHKAAWLKAYRSRGTLVKEWLQADGSQGQSLDQYVAAIARERDEFPGFNLLLGQLPTALHPEPRLAYVTNRDHTGSGGCGGCASGSGSSEEASHSSDGLSGEVKFFAPAGVKAQTGPSTETISDTSRGDSLPSGSMTREEDGGLVAQAPSYGLSNSVLSEPWAKVQSGRAGFDDIVSRYNKAVSPCGAKSSQEQGELAQRGKEELVRGLFAVLATPSLDVVTKRTDLRRTVLVPAFNVSPQQRADAWYGTRTSTVILVERTAPGDTGAAREGVKVTFIERDMYVLPPYPQEGGDRPATAEDGRPRLLSEEERARTERRYEFCL